MRYPDIKALVLAGGESVRMGTDKGDLIYHKKAQKFHVADMLNSLGLETYISVKDAIEPHDAYVFLPDNYCSIGPMGGILTAFENDCTAWLIIGCDYPLLEKSQIEKLLQARNKSNNATVYQNKISGHLIPTLAIYEPKIYPLLKKAQTLGNYSLSRVLQNNSANFVEASCCGFESIDTPEAQHKIIKIINEQYRQ